MIKEDFITMVIQKYLKFKLIKTFRCLKKTLQNYKGLFSDHDESISLNQKLSLSFKDIPTDKFWSNLMNEMNNSFELNSLINSKEIFQAFKLNI